MLKRALQVLFLVTSIALSTSLSAKVIMVFGDSLSSAYGMEVEQGWVSLLAQRLNQEYSGHRVVNASISGNTSGNGAGRIENDLVLHQPDILILELGGNDGLRGHSPKLFKANMEKIIRYSLDKDVEILLLGIKLPPSYGRRYGKAFETVYTELAETYPLTFLPFFMEKVGTNRALMQPDGIHPNEKGQPQLLDNVWPALKLLIEKKS